MRTRPDPTHLFLAAEFDELQESSAGWTFWAWAQFYGVVNDRGWEFVNGSFAKTNKERVLAGRVKVHDGHNLQSTGSGNVGRVLKAEESGRGNRAHIFLSRSEESLAQKVNDKTVTDVSVEVNILSAERVERPLESVPVEIRGRVPIAPNGAAEITAITEVRWRNLGLVSEASQLRDSLLTPPLAVDFQDLPVSLSAWDPRGARERVISWAGEGNIARLSRAYLVALPGGQCFGHFADVVDGELVAIADALESAYAAVEDGLGDRLADEDLAVTLAATTLQLVRYDKKKSLTLDLVDDISLAISADLALTAPPGGAEPPPDTPIAEPSGTCTHSDEGSEAKRLDGLLHTAKLQRLRHGATRSQSEPADPGGRNSARGRPERE